MKKITLLMVFVVIGMIANATTPTLPIDWNTIFASTAYNSSSNLLEYGTYNSSVNEKWYPGGLTGAVNPAVETSTLSYTSGSAYIDNSAGKAVVLPTTAAAARSSYYAVATATADYVSGSYYLSFLVNVTAAPTTGVAFTGFQRGNNAFRGRVFIKHNSETGFVLATGPSSSSTMPTTTTAELSYGTTHLIILKYTLTPAGTNYSYLFVNPTVGTTEPTPTYTSAGTSYSTDYLRGFDVLQATGLGYKIGGFRFSTSYTDVNMAAASTLPQLTAPIVGTPTTPTTDGFTANWSAVADAVSYDVYVYQGSVMIGEPHNTGTAVTSLAITGLSVGTTYTYQVVAKGDGVVKSNSEPSSSSSNITTLGLSKPVATDATSITTSGFTANWNVVTNASGYDVVIMREAEMLSTVAIGSQSTTSTSIAGLNMGTSYSYYVVAKGDGNTTFDSESSNTISVVTSMTTVASINTNFGDGSWGPTVSSTTSGSYGSRYINGFELAKSILYDRTSTGPKGESHVNSIAIDKSTNSGMLTFPELAAPVAQIEIHASTGSDLKSFTVGEYNISTSAWETIGTYDTMKSDSIYFVNPIYSTSTKFRIANATTSTLYIQQIITRTNNPTTLATPTVELTSGISGTSFTANWTVVANATGYVVRVYEAGLLVSTVNVSGQANESQTISGLKSETAYTYTVQAKGDGDVSFLDSFMSTAVAVTTSTATSLNSLEYSIQAIVSGKTLLFTENVNLNVYNLQGEQIMQASNVKSIDTNLNKGMYIVRFTNKVGKLMTQKIFFK